jgi:membrane protein DedA with SNARE-associated domain
VSRRRLEQLRRKAPQLILVGLVVIVAVYILLEILEDVYIEGSPVTSGPLISAIISLTRDTTATVRSWGYPAVFTLMLLESSSLPIPSEVVLPFAGFLISTGELTLWVTVTVATVAGVAGSLIDYYIGLKGVQSLVQHRVLGKILFSISQLETAAKWFNRHGALMVILGRLVPGFRTVVSFPAGAVRMSLAKFVFLTAAGCLLWNVILIYVGWFLGSNWAAVAGVLHYLIFVAVVAIGTVIVVYLIKRKQRRVSEFKTNGKTAA